VVIIGLIFSFYAFLFGGFVGLLGRCGIAAHWTAVLEHSVGAGKIAIWAADGGEKAAAERAGFYIAAYFVAAVIAKKTGFLLFQVG